MVKNTSNALKWIITILLFCVLLNANAQLTYDNLKVQYDSAWTFKNLQLIPIRFKQPGGVPVAGQASVNYIPLQDAMQSKKVKIKEILYQKGADINWLEVINNSKENVLVNSGSLLAGGKQDRIVAETKVLRPGKKDFVKVFCIEKGRWDRKAKSFAFSGDSDPVLKKVMDKTSRQQEVWKEIERQYVNETAKSETFPYLKLNRYYAKIDLDYIAFFTNKFKQSDSLFAGFLAVTGDRNINCELFASTDFTQSSFSTILRSWVSTAITSGAPPTLHQKDMEAFLDKFLINETIQKKYLATHGKIDKDEGKILHLIAYED